MEDYFRIHGLRKQHIKILQILFQKHSNQFTAREVSKNAELPLSRTYQALRELSSWGLIEKNLGSHITFKLPKSSEAFRKFFSSRTEQLFNFQQSMLDMVAEMGIRGRELEVLPSRDEFYQAIYQVLKEASSVRMLSRSHWGILPDREPNYWRTKSWALLKGRIEGGLEFWYILDALFLRHKINRWNAPVVHSNLQWFLDQPSVRLVSASIPNMTSTIITPEGAVVGFRHAGDRMTSKGLMVRSRDFLHFFNNVYDSLFNSGRDFHGLKKN